MKKFKIRLISLFIVFCFMLQLVPFSSGVAASPQRDTVPVSEIVLNQTALSLYQGDSTIVSATVIPENASDKTVVFSSENESIASVDQNGVIKALSVGETRIIASTPKGEVCTYLQITVLTKYFVVTFLDIDDSVISTQAVEKGKAAEAPNVGIHAGYSFSGWLEDFSEITSDLMVHSLWSEITYSLTYNADGGILPDNAIDKYTVTTPEFALPIPTKDYYFFAGWFCDQQLSGEPIVSVALGSTGDKSFYAKWTKIAYSISYVTNGGSFSSAVITSYDTETRVVLPIPVKIGNKFCGWYESSTFAGKPVSEIPKGSFGDKTFYAKWSVIDYAITYETNGGNIPGTYPLYYNIENSVVLPIPLREGYSFSGWYESSDFSGKEITEIAVGSFGNKTFYAKWSEIKYFITYQTNGGTNPANAPLFYTTASDTVLPIPEKKGYTFLGWYLSQDFSGTSISKIVKGQIGDITLYAKWTLTTYTITYVTNGGSVNASAPVSYTTESETVLPTCERKGYTFSGWYDNEALVGSSIAVINKGSYGNKTFYAKWKIITYSITYELFGGTNGVGAFTSYTIESPVIYLPTPTRRGYSFSGWYESAACLGEPVFSIPTGSVGDRKLYASWEAIEYSIRYELFGGVNPVNAPSGYNVETQDFELPVPTKNGYTFLGWYDNGAFSGNVVSEIVNGTVGDFIFYAKWSVTLYKITYNVNGGENPANAPKTYTIEADTIILPTPTRTGYSFCGWYTNQSFSGSAVAQIEKGSYGDKDFFAKWSAIEYSITYNTNGGVVLPDFITTYTIETETFMLPSTTKRGYTFSGWYTNSDLSGAKLTSVKKGSMGNIVLYAEWLVNSYSVTYITNGGFLPSGTPTIFTIETSDFVLPEPVKAGYTFCGWYDNPDFSGSVFTQIEKGSVGNKTFYAKYTPTVFKIKYVTNGGAFNQEHIIEYTIESPAITLVSVTKNAYDFLGWYLNSDFSGNAITNIPTGTYGDLTLYAKFTPTVYNIVYHVESELLPEDTVFSYTIESDTITLPRISKEGHVFVGWYINESLSGVPIREIPAGTFGEINLYANFRKLIYTVTFFDSDKETLLGKVSAEYGSEITNYPTPPEHYGYVFKAWSEDLSFIDKNMEVFAVYELKKYRVIFADMDYTILSEQYVEHGYAAVAPEPPTHEGAVFVFWSEEYSCVISDMTIVAVYRATTTIPPETKPVRFVKADSIVSGNEYIFASKDVYGDVMALSALDRLEGQGLWGLEIKIDEIGIRTAIPTGNLDDAIFISSGDDNIGYTLCNKQSREGLACQSGRFTMLSTETTENADRFILKTFEDGKNKLYDITAKTFVSLNDRGYFEPCEADAATEIFMYKKIQITSQYRVADEPKVTNSYTAVAIRPDGVAFALTAMPTEKWEGLVGIPVEIIGGALYFLDNVNEMDLSMRFIYGDNVKGFNIRFAATGSYLKSKRLATDKDIAAAGAFIYTQNSKTGNTCMYDYVSNTFLFCDENGCFTADNDISHTRIVLFERIQKEGKVGDANGDNSVNTGDVTILLQYSIQAAQLPNERLPACDTNGDGTINTGDATHLLKYLAGISDWLR